MVLHLANGSILQVSFFTADTSLAFTRRVNFILSRNRGSIPFNYLSVPIFISAPKSCYLQPMADTVRNKLASLKGNLSTRWKGFNW